MADLHANLDEIWLNLRKFKLNSKTAAALNFTLCANLRLNLANLKGQK